MRTGIIVAVVVSAALAVWETAARLGWADASLLPSFSEVMRILWRLARDEEFRGALLLTAQEVAVAFALVAPVAVLSGFLIGESPILGRICNPVLQLVMSIPQSTFLPVFILAFGIGFLEKVAFGMSLGFFVIASTTVAAVHAVPAGLLRASRAFGANRRQIYVHVYIPAMLPLIVSGLRIGLIFCITGVLLAEMYAAQNGIGRLIFAWGESFQLPQLLAGVVLVALLTVALNELMRLAERSVARGAALF